MKNQIRKLLFISFGAALGGLLRFHIEDYLTVNLFGAAILGFIFGLNPPRNLRLLIGFGFCGSLTTFSGWIVEIVSLISDGYIYTAMNSLLLMIFLSLIASYIGFFLGKNIKLLKLL